MTSWDELIGQGRGLVSVREVAPDRLRKRAQRGHVRQLLPGVYVLPELARDEDMLIRAAVQRFPNAVIGGVPAARRTFWPTIKPGDSILVWNVTSHTRAANFDFRSPRVDPEQVVMIGGIPFTSPARTALDLAVPTNARSIDEVLRSGQASLSTLWEVWAATPRRLGNGAVRRLLHDSRDTPWSADERFFHRALRERGVQGWSADQAVPLDGRMVFPDIGFRAEKVAAEIDGRHHRDDELTFQSDRERHNALTVAGWTVLHYTGYQIHADVDSVIRELVQMVCRKRHTMSRSRGRASGNAPHTGFSLTRPPLRDVTG